MVIQCRFYRGDIWMRSLGNTKHTVFFVGDIYENATNIFANDDVDLFCALAAGIDVEIKGLRETV